MSSQNKKMAQALLVILKYYNIIAPTVQNATNPLLLQECDSNIPQGIPALLAYSQVPGNDNSPDKTMVMAFLEHHVRNLPKLRLVALACGLLYLSRPMIGPVLSSAWEETSQVMDELLTWHPLPNFKTEAKHKLQLKPKRGLEPNPNLNTNAEPELEPKTVTMTAAELRELISFADATEVRLDEAKTLQEDLLTANCELEDDVERLENDIKRLEKQVKDDAAHSEARIRALNDHIETQEDGKRNVWNERERYRLGGKDLKTMLDALQAEFNELEDDRDEWSEMAVELAMELQGELDDMTTERDDLQANISQLETEKQDLESSLAQKLADQKASDERQAELEKSAADAAKALSDAVATQQKQDMRIEELEAKKKKEVADAMNALTTFKAQVQADQYEDLGKKMRAAVDEEKRKTELQDLNKAHEYLKIDNEALRSAERDHEEAVEEYQDTCEDLEQEVRKQKKDLQVAEGEMAGLRAEIAALKDRLEAQSTGAKDGSRQDDDEHDSSNDNAGKADQGGDDDDDAADDDADDGSSGAGDTVTDDNGAQGDKGVTDTPPSAAESGYPSLTPSDGGQSQSPTPHTPQSSTSSGSAPATGSVVGAITSRLIAVEDTPDIDPQRETIEESEVGALPGQPDAQTDLTANKDETDKAQVERLQVQLNVEQANYNFVFKKKEVFRHGGKQLKKKLESLQAEYNVLEDGRDTWKETCEALEQQADVRAVRALHNQIASDKVDHERRIEALETQLGFEKTNREDAQKVARELRESSKKLRNELKEANMKHESLQIAYNELDNMHGAEERANEDKDEEITDLRTELDRVEANLSALNERYIELNAERTGAAETVAVAEEEESRQNGEAIFQKPEGSRTTSAEEGAPLRRIQSAPLWLPPPHHGDTFDHLYDVSDYGDDDRDHKDGDEDRGEDPGEHGDKHDSGNDKGSGPDEDDKKDDDDQDNGRDGGTEKVTADAYQTRKDCVADSPALSEDTPSLADPQTPEPSSQRASFRLNGSASKFVPSVRPKRPAPPILPHHQAYIASQHGVNSSDSESSSASPLHNFRTYSAAKSGTLSPEAIVQGSVGNQQPFPGVYDSTLPHHDELPEHMPAPKAAGPEDAKNAHIQKLNEQVKRLEWMKKSGKPDLVEDREGVAGPDDVLDGMYDRQVTRFLECTPIRCARGSMWGALNDIPNPLENMSIPSTPSSSRLGSSQMNSNQEERTAETSVEGARREEKYGEDLAGGLATAPELPVEEDVPASSSGTPEGDEECEDDGEWSDIQAEDHEEIDDGMPMLGNYKVTRGQTNDQENGNGPMLGNHKVTHGPKPTKDHSMPMLGRYEVTRAQIPPSSEPGAPKVEEESGADGGWTDVEDEGDDEDQNDHKDGVTSPLPLPQAQPSAQESSPLAAHATAASSPAAQGHTSDEPNAEAARDAQPAERRLSNIFPGSENATKTHDEDVGDAFVDYVRQHGAKKLEESTWADKLDADTTPRVRLPTPRWCGIDNPDQTPRVRLPRPPKASQAQPPPVIPATCTSTQGELENGPNPEAAPFDTREVRAFESPSKPAYRGSPMRNAIGAPPFKKNNGGMQHRNGATPAGVAGGSDSWSTRGSGRGGRGGRGGHGGRGAHQVQRAAPQNLTANGPRAEPMTPAARNGSQSPGFSVRGRGGGRAGRGGHQAGRQQQGPVRGSTPNAAATTTTTNINKKQTPWATRGGLGGPVTPTPQPGPARGSRFANTANSSFQRWQDSMAKKQQE